MDRDLVKIWNAVLEGMKIMASEASFRAYIKNTKLLSTETIGDKLLCEVNCPSAFIKSTLEQKYSGQLTRELERISEQKCEIIFRVENKKTEVLDENDQNLPLFEKRDTLEIILKARLKREFTFENYAVSGNNQMAYAAATAVAKNPGVSYNPLFIYGGVGVGKTHLMQAIGHVVIEKGGGSVLFCTGEEFTNDLVEGIRNKSTDKMRSKYRKVKALLIDDVQFIAGKASVQEEFFHTFNAIQREGGQIVMTSDKPPSEITKLEERLKSRFGAGMIVDVGPADFELRTAILLIKAKQKQINLPMEIAQTIANHIEGVRELEGCLTRIMTESEVKNEPISLEMAEAVLKITRTDSEKRKVITPNEVTNLVADYFKLGIQQLKGDRRTKTIAWPRQILMYLLRTELRLPQEEVGRLVGGRDHSTVIHATDKVQQAIKNIPDVNNQILEIKKKMLISS